MADASPSLPPSAAPVCLAPPVAARETDPRRWVPETRFGHWFLGTKVWTRYVVEVAINQCVRLLPPGAKHPRHILDAGSGPGVALPLLDRHFRPELITALDIDPAEVARSQAQARLCSCRVEVRAGDAAHLPLADRSVDMVLCHQTLHHVVRQSAVLREFYRVLAPGGTLLLAESCRSFIHSLPVALLFRHPNEVQRTAAEYQQLVRDAGFDFGPEHVATAIPFWTLYDWGLTRRLGWRRARPDAQPTEVTLVAFKRDRAG